MNGTLPFTPEAIQIMADSTKWRSCSPDQPPCAKCQHPIVECMPIRLFRPDEKKEIAFHLECAFRIGSFSIEKETEEDIKENMQNVECFYCDKLDACLHIHSNYKAGRRKRK